MAIHIPIPIKDKVDIMAWYEMEVLNARSYYCALAFKITHDYYAAEEVSQDAFLKALKMLVDYDSLDYKVENPRAWLGVIVKHTAIDYIRRQTRFAQISLDASEVQGLQASRFARPDAVAEDDVTLEIIESLFNELG